MTRNGRPGSNGSPAAAGGKSESESGVSGRVMVSAAAVVVLLTWGGLSLAFRTWRDHYRERAEYGSARVAGSIDPLAAVVPADEVAPALRAVASAGTAAVAPPGVGPGAWIGAVGETRAMLVTADHPTLCATHAARLQKAKDSENIAKELLAQCSAANVTHRESPNVRRVRPSSHGISILR